MRRSKSPRPLHATAALLLFLFGSNFCIVTALASPSTHRAGVMCHDVSEGGAKKASTATSSCCSSHAAKNERSKPVRTPGSPCCMDLAQVSGPEVTKQACETPTPVVTTVQGPALTSATPRIPAHPPRTDLRARPLASPAGGPLALRAPPRI